MEEIKQRKLARIRDSLVPSVVEFEHNGKLIEGLICDKSKKSRKYIIQAFIGKEKLQRITLYKKVEELILCYKVGDWHDEYLHLPSKKVFLNMLEFCQEFYDSERFAEIKIEAENLSKNHFNRIVKMTGMSGASWLYMRVTHLPFEIPAHLLKFNINGHFPTIIKLSNFVLNKKEV